MEQAALGAASLTVLSISILDSNGILPETFRQLFHEISVPLETTLPLFYGNPFSQVIAVTNIIVYIAQQLFTEDVHYINTGPTAVTPETLLSLTTDQLSLNKGHLIQDLTPQVPNIALSELNTICDELPWENHRAPLEQKPLNDPGFTDQDPIAYLKKRTRTLVSSIENHQILAGEPQNYQFLEDHLKIIIDVMRDQDEITRADMIMELSLEGNDCGSGTFRVVSDV